MLRRSQVADGPPALRVGHLHVEAGQFVASAHGRPLDLRPQEFRLLRVLASHAGLVFSREQLMDLAWQHTVVPSTVDAHICRLRRKVADANVRIESVWGRGCRLII